MDHGSRVSSDQGTKPARVPGFLLPSFVGTLIPGGLGTQLPRGPGAIIPGDQGTHPSSLQGISAAWRLGSRAPGDQGMSTTLRTWFPGIVGPRDLGGKETTQRGTRAGPIT